VGIAATQHAHKDSLSLDSPEHPANHLPIVPMLKTARAVFREAGGDGGVIVVTVILSSFSPFLIIIILRLLHCMRHLQIATDH
jgi:hypothetical protein